MRITFYFLIVHFFISLNALSGQQFSNNYIYNLTDTIDYLIYYPKDYKSNQDSLYPLLLCLHGGGESGNNIEKFKNTGIPMFIEKGHEYPFLILAPQNPAVKGFQDEKLVMALLSKIIEKEKVDTNRIYLTGYSRGGYGAWSIARQYHNVFAAVVPISGAVPSSYAKWLEDIPFWIFHGADDNVISINESIDIVSEMKKMGLNPKFSIFKGVGHNVWDSAYADPVLSKWLLEQSRK